MIKVAGGTPSHLSILLCPFAFHSGDGGVGIVHDVAGKPISGLAAPPMEFEGSWKVLDCGVHQERRHEADDGAGYHNVDRKQQVKRSGVPGRMRTSERMQVLVTGELHRDDG